MNVSRYDTAGNSMTELELDSNSLVLRNKLCAFQQFRGGYQ